MKKYQRNQNEGTFYKIIGQHSSKNVKVIKDKERFIN